MDLMEVGGIRCRHRCWLVAFCDASDYKICSEMLPMNHSQMYSASLSKM
jgi:hypothetical protein